MYQKAQRDFTLSIPQEELADNVEVLAPLSITQENFINCTSDIVLWSGGQNSGKSYLCLIDLLIGAVDDEHFTSTVIRTSQKKIKQSGGLFDMSMKLFPKFEGSSNQVEMTFKFPVGSSIKYHHLGNHNIGDYQGSNNTRILIDEAAEEGIEEEDVSYLISRLRGKSKQKKSLKMTGNPNRSSFLCNWLEKGGYLDSEGFHREDMHGVERLMVMVGGSYEFFKTRAEIKRKYGKAMADNALTFTSFNANIFANPYVLKYDSFSLTSLENLKDEEKQRLLYGNWYSSSDSNGYLERDMLKVCKLSDVPLGLPIVRAWDLASTAKAEEGEDNFGDYTVGIKAAYDKEDGSFYILDMQRFQENSAGVVSRMIQTAKDDGKSVYQILPQDPGSAGKILADSLKSRLMSECKSRVIVEKTSKSKLRKAEPFLIAAQEGKVSFVKHVFNDEHLSELESFDGERSTRRKKDDIMDSVSSAYAHLSTGRLIPTIKIGNTKQDMKRLSNIGGRTLL
ncbi:phage terminase large subunit [Halomonas sp. 25-S5]|uniref:phage terminase large subunit n=1 Tax=Halomonas sp. 25-S5 TaxID=2994065 RepID=UPI00246872ED|nr:phage terminase large subunit [Halomonas sp. 25-S5]